MNTMNIIIQIILTLAISMIILFIKNLIGRLQDLENNKVDKMQDDIRVHSDKINNLELKLSDINGKIYNKMTEISGNIKINQKDIVNIGESMKDIKKSLRYVEKRR